MSSEEKSDVLVGLTGGIGTGKSKVSDLLRELGAAVECSDLIVRELQAPGGEGLKRIVERFGEEYLTEAGELDRAGLGQLVFRDLEARTALNNIIHPLVFQTFAERIRTHREDGREVIVIDIPLLLEGKRAGRGSGAQLPFDLIVVVYASEAQQLRRVIERDGLSEDDARARIGSQISIEDKREMADIVIDNSGGWDKAADQVRDLYAGWVSRAPASRRR